MFISNSEKKSIFESIENLEKRFDLLFQKSKIVEEVIFVLRDRIDLLEKAPHGIRKDGTPRKKPGRKANQSLTVTVK